MKRSINRLVSLLVVGALVFPLGLFISSGGMGINTVKLSGNNDVREKEHSVYFHKSNLLSNPLGEWHVYPGDKIQGAIDNASAGDIVYVHDDNGDPYTYHENVDVNKPDLMFIGDGMDTVRVDALNTEDHTVYIAVDGVNMSGFTVTGSYLCGYGGICVEGANYCKIHENNCTENWCAGLFLKSSYNCEITDNIVSDGDGGGIKIVSSDHNVIKNNIVEHNPVVGLALYQGSSDNLIYNNYFNDNGELGGGNVIDNIPWENTWNISKTPATNIVGGPYLGGNYFSDYTGEDNDGDGLGDTPYKIINYPQGEITNKDYLPLVMLNNPPDAPSIDGPTSGKVGVEYEYTFVTTDPKEDDVCYFVDWGDDTSTGWTEYAASGTEITLKHTWTKEGTYNISTKAKDIHDAEGEWGYLKVSMPKDKVSTNTLFFQFLERTHGTFPLLERMFHHFNLS